MATRGRVLPASAGPERLTRNHRHQIAKSSITDGSPLSRNQGVDMAGTEIGISEQLV